MLLSKEYSFEAAHRLWHHKGKCKNLHGHSYKVKITIAGKVNPDTDMVLDFSDLSAIAKPIIEELDHALLIKDDDTPLRDLAESYGFHHVVFVTHPTAEAIAKRIAALMTRNLFTSGVSHVELESVEVKETETSTAVWNRENDV